MKTSKMILFSIFFVVFIDIFGYSLIFNLLGPMLLKPEYGMISPSTSVHLKNGMLALIFAIFPLAQFFTSPIIGELADMYGRKKAFFLSLLGITIGFLFSAWAVFIKSICLLFFSRLITGACAGNISICMASIADLSHEEKERGKNFSMVTAIFGFSWVCAAIVGGYIGNPKVLGDNGPGYIFLFTAGLSLIAFFVIIFFYEETFFYKKGIPFSFSQGITNIKEVLQIKVTRVYFLIYTLWSMGWIMAVQWFPVYSIEVYKASINMFTTWYLIRGITWILGAFFAKHFLIPRLKTLTVAVIGFFCMTIAIFFMQFVSVFFLFGLFFVIGSFFAVFSMSSSLSLISLHAKKEVQGKIMGLSQSAQSIAFVIGPCIGLLVSLYTISILFYFAGFICLIPTILLLYKFFLKKNDAI